MPAHPQPGALAATLKSERAGMQALFEILTAERTLLESGQTDRLVEIADRKRGLLLHVANLGDYRKRLLEHAGVRADRSGFHAPPQVSDTFREARAEWQALVDLTEKARRLNNENGIHIEAGMRSNQHALSVLMSAVPNSTYGPGGRTSNPLSSRPLTSA
jgi:flagellar biosynthesis/type III secretory pathway chaperone